MASNDARIQISQNNAQLRYQAEVQASANKESVKQNIGSALQLSTDMISRIVESSVEENAEENVRNYQMALQDAIMSGNFEFKNMNAEEGLAETWEDYWGNYKTFTENWLGEKSNYKGGFLSKAATKKAVNNYLSNSMTDIADSRKTQLWEQKVATRQKIQSTLFSSVFDEEEYKSNFATLIANDKFAIKGVTSMEGLADVTEYGINKYYENYVNNRILMENGQDNNYYESALNLQEAMRAYVGEWGEDYFKSRMASSERAEELIGFNLIQATEAYGNGLIDDLVSLCNSTGGDITKLQEFITANKIGDFIKGQNGLLIRTDGLTEEEITSANNQLAVKLTEQWTKLSAQNVEMYTDLYSDLANAMGEENGLLLYSIDDIISFKDSNSQKYGSLSDEYVKSQVKKDDKLMSMMKSNSVKKSNLDAINVLGTAQEMWNTWTPEEQEAHREEMEAARNTLWTNNYWPYASGYFNFGSSADVSDDTGSWKNETTGVIFDYMKKHNVDFTTAAIGSGFYDTVLSAGVVAGSEVSAGDFLPAWTVETGRYMDNNASAFFDAAFSTNDILLGSYTQEEIDAKFSDESAKVKEAARLSGVDVESNETGYNNLVEAYRFATESLSIGGRYIGDETTLREVYLNKVIGLNGDRTTKEKSDATDRALAYRQSLIYSLNQETLNLGYMLVNSSVDGSTAYNRDVVIYAVQSQIGSWLNALKEEGTKEDVADFCSMYGNETLSKAISEADDWQALITSDFISKMTDSYCNTSLNFYNSFAGSVDLSNVAFMTATGSTDSIIGTIKTNVKDPYINASDAWLRMQYKNNPNAVYGKDYNGVSVAGTSIVEDGSVGSDLFQYYAARVAFATSDSDRLSILSEANGYLCEDALKVLNSGESLNIALMSTGLFDNETIQSILVKEFGTSEFGKLQNDTEYNEFAAYLGNDSEFLAQVKMADSRLKAGESEADVRASLVTYLQNSVTGYITYANEEKIKATEKALNAEAGIGFTITGSLEAYNDTKDAKKADTAHKLFKNITNDSSSLSNQYFAGDLTTRSNIDALFISGGLEANANQADLYNLAVEITSGNVASTDKNSFALVCGVIAYNQMTGSKFTLDTTRLTSDNIKAYEEELTSYLATMTPTQQYDWLRLQSSISLIAKTVSKYDKLGFNDTLSYATLADGSFGFISDKSTKVKINPDGTIALTLPDSMGGEIVQNVGLYSDGPNRNDVVTSLFDSDSVEKGGLVSPPAVKNFVSIDGATTVKSYNEIKEYLDGVGETDAILVAYPVGISISNGNVRFVYEGPNSFDSDNPNYYVYQLTVDTATTLYDFYNTNGMGDKAEELCSMLTDKQVETIKAKSAAIAEAKAAREAELNGPVPVDEAVDDFINNSPNSATEGAIEKFLYSMAYDKETLNETVTKLEEKHNSGELAPGIEEGFDEMVEKAAQTVSVAKGFVDPTEGTDPNHPIANASVAATGAILNGKEPMPSPKDVVSMAASMSSEQTSDTTEAAEVSQEIYDSVSEWATANPEPNNARLYNFLLKAEDIDSAAEALKTLAKEGKITLPTVGSKSAEDHLAMLVRTAKKEKTKEN